MDVAPLAASMVETTLCGVKVKPEKQYWPGPACVKFAAVSPDDPAASNVPSELSGHTQQRFPPDLPVRLRLQVPVGHAGRAVVVTVNNDVPGDYGTYILFN